MILEAIIKLLTGLLKVVFSVLPNIPDFPSQLLNSIHTVTNTIFSNLDLLGLFVRVSTIKALVPLVIIVVNFERLYHFSLWLIKKLPLSVN